MDEDDAELLKWALTTPARQSSEMVTISCERLVIAQMERCAENLKALDPDGYRLLEAIRNAHLAMVAGMTAALGGSAGIGALSSKNRAKAIAAINEGRWQDIPEHVSPFAELLQEIQSSNSEWGSVALTQDEAEACKLLNSRRERIDHPKPALFLESRVALRQICASVSVVLPRIAKVVQHHFEIDELERIDILAQRIARACA